VFSLCRWTSYGCRVEIDWLPKQSLHYTNGKKQLLPRSRWAYLSDLCWRNLYGAVIGGRGKFSRGSSVGSWVTGDERSVALHTDSTKKPW